MADDSLASTSLPDLAGKRALVTGAGGQVGSFLVRLLAEAGADVYGLGARAGSNVDEVVDIRDPAAVERAVAEARPDAIIHAAAYTDVDGCERDPARAMAVNADGSGNVAAAAATAGARLIAISTDFVFAGDGGAPYDESAEPRPVSVYGSSKLAGEQAVLDVDPAFAVVRTAWVWGGAGKHFPRTVLSVLQSHGAMEVVEDEAGNPTHAGDLALGIIRLLVEDARGIYHLAGKGRTTRFELARAVAAAGGMNPATVTPTTTEAFLAKYPLPARRPADSTLADVRAAELGIELPPWREAVERAVPALARELRAAPSA